MIVNRGLSVFPFIYYTAQHTILRQLMVRSVSTLQPIKGKKSNFKELDGTIDPFKSDLIRTGRLSDEQEAKYYELLKRARQGGSPRSHEMHTKKNKKLFARERIRMLLDPGTEEDCLEIAPFAGLDMEYGDVPAAGVVSIIGRIHGKWCFVGFNDATIKGGTVYPIGLKKQIRGQDICIQTKLPGIYGVDSGGAFLPLQADIFPDKRQGGRTFYHEAILSSQGIPQLAIVNGSCTAGGAYIPAMAEEAVIVHKIGTIFLGGPPLVLAATGEVVTAEELGGATLHCKVSGVTDHFAATEAEAYETGRDIVSTLAVCPPEDPVDWDEPNYSPHDLKLLAPSSHSPYSSYSVKKILARLVDGSRFLEFKTLYGPELVTGFAHIKGYLVGIIANDGQLDAAASLKGAHFIELCQQRDIPLIYLQNVTTDEKWNSPEEAAEALKARAKMMRATACATVPKITVVIGQSFGPANYVMCGRSMQPNFLFSWPQAQIGMHTPEQSASLSQETSEEPISRAAFERQSTAWYSSFNLFDDGVILPQDTRHVLGMSLSIVSQQKFWYNNSGQSTRNFGVFRM